MSKKEWGNAVWNLFHVLTVKLKPEYESEIPKIIDIITNVCEMLPCPICKEHSMAILSKIKNTEMYKNKESLVRFVWRFHNTVNVSIKHPILNYDDLLPLYDKLNTITFLKTFIQIMRKQTNPTKKLLYSFHRNIYIKNFIEYIKKNIQKFNW